jgi:response regulator NasT
MSESEVTPRRVLVAHERHHRLDTVAEVVARLGHEVVVRPVRAADVAEITATERPDVAIVSVGSRLDEELELISAFVRVATCPVIALLRTSHLAPMREAARRGAFALVRRADPAELQGAIDIAVHRFTEYRGLQDAFARRAVIEQAKGILMARNGIDDETAFAMLREHSQNNGRKLVAVAEGVVRSHQLLAPSAENSARAQS